MRDFPAISQTCQGFHRIPLMGSISSPQTDCKVPVGHYAGVLSLKFDEDVGALRIVIPAKLVPAGFKRGAGIQNSYYSLDSGSRPLCGLAGMTARNMRRISNIRHYCLIAIIFVTSFRQSLSGNPLILLDTRSPLQACGDMLRGYDSLCALTFASKH